MLPPVTPRIGSRWISKRDRCDRRETRCRCVPSRGQRIRIDLSGSSAGDDRPLSRCLVAAPFALLSAARWPATPRGDWSGRCVDGDDVDELLVDELLNTEAGELVPVARHFDPAERQV